MPELADTSSLPTLSENPYPASLEVLMRMSTSQMHEAILRGKNTTIDSLKRTGKRHLVPRAEEIFNILYNVFLVGPSAEIDYLTLEGATDQEKRDSVLAAQITHKLVQNIWCAKIGVCTPEQVRAREIVVSTMEALLNKPENNMPIIASRRQ